MDVITIQIVLTVAIIGFLWNLHRNVTDLRERMTRVEGLLEDFVGHPPEPQA